MCASQAEGLQATPATVEAHSTGNGAQLHRTTTRGGGRDHRKPGVKDISRAMT